MAAICWLLLATCCVQPSLTLRINHESVSDTIAKLQGSRQDLAIILPLELHLKMRPSTGQMDYGAAVDLLLEVIQKRRKYLQKYFYSENSPVGFLASTSRRINEMSGVFTLYYYAAYIGTSNLRTLSNQLKKFCSAGSDRAQNCSDISFLSVVMSNLLLLSSFKYLPRNTAALSQFFTDFEANATGFVIADISDAHDVHHLLCNEFLRCGPTNCNLSSIIVPWAIRESVPWKYYETFVASNMVVEDGGAANNSAVPIVPDFTNIMRLNLSTVFEDSFRKDQDNFGYCRSWCYSNPGSQCTPSSSVTLLLWAIHFTIVLIFMRMCT